MSDNLFKEADSQIQKDGDHLSDFSSDSDHDHRVVGKKRRSTRVLDDEESSDNESGLNN